MRDPFDVPDLVAFDLELGLSLNLRAQDQEWPGWWVDQPERYEALKAAREAAGLETPDDDIPVPVPAVERPPQPVRRPRQLTAKKVTRSTRDRR